MRTLHEDSDGQAGQPIRLSYRGKSYYNAVVSLDWKETDRLVKSKPGEMENEAIRMSKQEGHQEVHQDENVTAKQV